MVALAPPGFQVDCVSLQRRFPLPQLSPERELSFHRLHCQWNVSQSCQQQRFAGFTKS